MTDFEPLPFLSMYTGESPSELLHCFSIVLGATRTKVVEQFDHLRVAEFPRCNCRKNSQNLAVQPVSSRLGKGLVSVALNVECAVDCFFDAIESARLSISRVQLGECLLK